MTGRKIDDIILLKKFAYWGGSQMRLTTIQLSAFGYFRDIQPEQNNLVNLMNSLPGFIPGTTLHLNINAASGKVENLQRIVMNNNENGWRIEVQLDRINAVCTAGTNTNALCDRDKLVADGIDYLKKCIDSISFRKLFTRLAINAQYVKPTGKVTPTVPFGCTMPKYITNIDEVCEWNLTFNRKGQLTINSVEITNEILACSLGNSITDPSEHAMLITVDINTSQNSLAERFSFNDMGIFSKYALKRWDEMMSSL